MSCPNRYRRGSFSFFVHPIPSRVESPSFGPANRRGGQKNKQRMITSVNIVGIRHASSSSTFFFFFSFFLFFSQKTKKSIIQAAREMHLPVWTAFIGHVFGGPRGCAGTSKSPGWHVWVIITRRRHGRTSVIKIIIGTTRRGKVFHPGTRGSTTSVSITIIVPTQGSGGTLAIVAWAVTTTGWRESPVVVINGRIASAGRASPVRLPVNTVILGLDLRANEMRISFQAFPGQLRVLTSGTQVTLAPLNSRPSSLSTAVFRSFAVSNSTNLCLVLMLMGVLDFPCGNADSNPPSSEFTAGFRVNYIEPRLTAEVFEILKKGMV